MTAHGEPDETPDDEFETVYVESDYWDGPLAGLADVDGVPHYFHTTRDIDDEGPCVEFYVWPASDAAVAWEREQWAIFVNWRIAFDAGEVTLDTHPALPAMRTRYDELTHLLEPYRVPPDGARRLVAEWKWPSAFRDSTYRVDGVTYRVRWRAELGD